MDIIKCVIRGQRLSVNVPVMADLTVRYFNVMANFDSTWEPYTQRWVHIHKVTDTTIGSDWVLDSDNKVAAGEEIHLDTGEWEIWFHGVILDDNDDVYSRITTEIKTFRVVESGTDGGLMPSVPESNVEQITAIAQEALDTVEALEDRADSGEFNGATFTPAVSAEGIISWSNDKDLPNPQSVDIKGPPGEGISVKGVVDDESELPVSANNGDTYLVGTEAPYNAFIWTDGEWVDNGPLTLGPKGDDGEAATIAVGTTTTLPAGSSASVTNSGTSSAAVFNFSIPQGANGNDGADGADGEAATVAVGTTTTLPAGSSATVTNSGTSSAAVLNFGIPQGAKGDDGADGADGEGVPTGGTTGQLLAKKTNTNFDTEWVDPPTIPQATSTTPLMDGTASVGSETAWAKGDHVHPHDNLIVRENLLYNWYFVGGGTGSYDVFPVNQRGQSVYSTTDAYCIDRWKLRADSGGSCTVSANYITLGGGSSTCAIVQTYPNGGNDLRGKVITFSAVIDQITGGPVYLVVGNATTNIHSGTVLGDVEASVGINSLTVTVPSTLNNSFLNFIIVTNVANTSFSVSAAKLEIGNTQTLAHIENSTVVLNEIPNHFNQLRKCKEYFYRWKTLNPYTWVLSGVMNSNTQMRGMMPIPNMRADKYPVITFSGSFSVVVEGYSDTYAVSSFSAQSANSEQLVLMINCAQVSHFSLLQSAIFRVENDSNAYIDISFE